MWSNISARVTWVHYIGRMQPGHRKDYGQQVWIIPRFLSHYLFISSTEREISFKNSSSSSLHSVSLSAGLSLLLCGSSERSHWAAGAGAGAASFSPSSPCPWSPPFNYFLTPEISLRFCFPSVHSGLASCLSLLWSLNSNHCLAESLQGFYPV